MNLSINDVNAQIEHSRILVLDGVVPEADTGVGLNWLLGVGVTGGGKVVVSMEQSGPV